MLESVGYTDLVYGERTGIGIIPCIDHPAGRDGNRYG